MPSNHFSVVFKTTHARTNQRWTNDTKRFRRLVCFEEEKAERPLAAPFCSSVDTPTTKCSFFFFFFFWRTPPPHSSTCSPKKETKKKRKKITPPHSSITFWSLRAARGRGKEISIFSLGVFLLFSKKFRVPAPFRGQSVGFSNNSTEPGLVLTCCTGFYWVLPSFTGFYQVFFQFY